MRIIGDWGGASGHIGRRWEELGTEALSRWVEKHLPSARVADLASRENLRALFDSLGITNPDTVLAEASDGRTVLRPVDLKWTLEVASYRQISGAALADLLAAAGEPLARVIADALGGDEGSPDGRTREWVTEDGFFFVVDSLANRRYLSSEANSRQEYPLEPSEVVFQAIDPTQFFGPLPGWEQALRLASLDRSIHSLGSIDGATAYYRLGAGLRGALLRLNTPIFSPDLADGDVEQELENLIASRRPANSAAVIAALEPDLARRAERQQRLRELTRSPFTFDQFRARLSSRGIDLDAVAEPVEKNRLVERYRLIARRHRERLIKAGQSLLARGFTEAQALVALEKRTAEFEQRAAADAQAILQDPYGAPQKGTLQKD